MDRMFLLLLSIIWIGTSHECGIPVPPSKVVGGQEVSEYVYSWFAHMLYNDRPICAGTLITETHVLTAAHCIIGPASSYSIELGRYNSCETQEATAKKFDVLDIKVHEMFSSEKNQYDLAVMTIDPPATEYGRICLPEEGENDKGEPSRIVGFGATDPNTQEMPCVMQEANITKYTKRECAQYTLLGPDDVNDPGKICAGRIQGGKDTCQGDSGGPLMTCAGNGIYEIAGIVSYGYGCANPALPGIYTNVAYYMGWIRNITEGSENRRRNHGTKPRPRTSNPHFGNPVQIQPPAPWAPHQNQQRGQHQTRDIFNRPLKG